MPSHQATSQILQLLGNLPADTLAAVGRITAIWAHLECEFDFALEGLLFNKKAEGLHDDYIILPFKRRLGIMRAAGKLVYEPPVFTEFERVLSAVANAHGKRDPIVHGRILPDSKGFITIEEHRHTSKGGSFRVATRTYTLKRLIKIGDEIAAAAGTFVAFNRQHLPLRPASWLDRWNPQGLGHDRPLPQSIRNRSKPRRPKPRP